MAALLNQGFEQMDVPPERRDHAWRAGMPSLVGTAHAATLAMPVHPAGGACAGGDDWHLAIQVGSFASERAAREAASNARRAADDGEVRVEPASRTAGPSGARRSPA